MCDWFHDGNKTLEIVVADAEHDFSIKGLIGVFHGTEHRKNILCRLPINNFKNPLTSNLIKFIIRKEGKYGFFKGCSIPGGRASGIPR